MSPSTPPCCPQLRLFTAVWCSIFLVVLAASAFGQTSQVLLGNPGIESSLDQNPSGMAEAFPVRARATGQVSSLSLFLDPSNTAPTVWVGMYTNENGHPKSLVSQSVISSPLAGRWNVVSIPPVQVNRGTAYWMALLGVNGLITFRDRTGWCRSETSQQTNLGSLPANWVSGTGWATCIVSMFEMGTVTADGNTQGATVSVSPHAISLKEGQQEQFVASVSGMDNTAVTWTASGGTIDGNGLYTAPSSAGTYIVTARSAAHRWRSDSAVVTVAQPSPTPVPSSTSVSISPTASSLQAAAQQQFTALVSGTSNTGVTWSASGGNISSTGLYTAPGIAGTYTITAISKADTTKSASAMVIVSVPQTVAVSISPATASVRLAQQVQFTAIVSGLSNTAVTWAVTQGTGTISQSGLYTAPQGAENDVITVTSQADKTKSASASVTFVPQHSVSLNWDASTSTAVAFYKVYRGSASGGPYSLLANNVTSTTYTDSAVQPGTTYYYVTTTVDTNKSESIFSNEFQSMIPAP